LEQVTGSTADRYMFRSSPLRNLALQAAFFHNGCFTRLEDAVRFHLDVFTGAQNYDPVKAGVAADLAEVSPGPIEPVLARVDPLLSKPISLTDTEFSQLVSYLRDGLLDKRARPENLRDLVPEVIPSGRAPLTFEFQAELQKK
jgi:cytochrome c peroxidase